MEPMFIQIGDLVFNRNHIIEVHINPNYKGNYLNDYQIEQSKDTPCVRIVTAEYFEADNMGTNQYYYFYEQTALDLIAYFQSNALKISTTEEVPDWITNPKPKTKAVSPSDDIPY